MAIALVDTIARIKKLAITFKAFTGKTSILNGLKIFSPTINHYHIGPEEFSKFSKTTQEAELAETVQEYVKEGRPYAFIATGNLSNFQKIQAVVSDQSRAKLIDFINTNIPRQDRGLWISGLVLRGLTNREEIKKIKSDMRDSAGHRGKNIANLCNSKYLESKIIPLYQELIGLPKGEESFLSSYDQIVNYPVFAVFVGENQTKDEILEEIRTKINILLHDNNQDQIDIHGFNQTNVNKIKEVLQLILNEYSGKILTHSIHGGDTFIKVQIFLKHK